MAIPKKTAKIMDGVHPSDTPPTTSGRPVIVTNRSVLTTDPMLNAGEGVSASVEKPSGEAAATPSGVPKITRAAGNLIPVDTTNSEVTAAAAEPSEGQGAEVAESKETEKPTQSVEAEQDPEVPQEEPTQKREKLHIAPLHEMKPTSDEDESQVKSDDSEETSYPGSTEVPEKQEDSKSAQELEIERHITAGTYFVPIGQIKRRRRMLTTLIILTLLTVIIVVDLLLDMELLNFNLPHTTFLS
ncbi:hypothetical protein IPL85_06150 [Candidatus Saccharibacteria bacterium]|nr:MAG: hypothetical protein IPL85_06150 [Candidatus Saccharibacteria bacterium]